MAKATTEAGAIVRIRIPTQLRSYTGGQSSVTIALPVLAPEHPPTLSAVLAALDTRFPGIRFRIVDEQRRIRPHIKVFIGLDLAPDLGAFVPADREVMIVGALSGG
jgi:hypothetical protein